MKITTKHEIDEKRRFARRICPRCVDPRVQVVGAVELILVCLREARLIMLYLASYAWQVD